MPNYNLLYYPDISFIISATLADKTRNRGFVGLQLHGYRHLKAPMDSGESTLSWQHRVEMASAPGTEKK